MIVGVNGPLDEVGGGWVRHWEVNGGLRVQNVFSVCDILKKNRL